MPVGIRTHIFWSWSVRSTSGLQPLHRYLNFLYLLGCKPFISKAMFENNKIFLQGSDYCQIFAEKIKWTDEKFQNEEFFSTSLFSGEIFVDKDLQKFLQMDFFPLCSFLLFDRQMKFSLLRKKLDHHFKKSFFLLLQTFLFHLFSRLKSKKTLWSFWLRTRGRGRKRETDRKKCCDLNIFLWWIY